MCGWVYIQKYIHFYRVKRKIECAAGFIKDFCLIQSLGDFNHLFTYSLAILTCKMWSDPGTHTRSYVPPKLPLHIRVKALYFTYVYKNIYIFW